MRKAAEKALNPAGGWSPTAAAAFFKKYPPLSSAGKVRYAEALMATGDRAGAIAAARDAWTAGPLSTVDEAEVIGGFSTASTPPDENARVDTSYGPGPTGSAAPPLAK